MRERKVVWTWSKKHGDYLKVADIGTVLPAGLFERNGYQIKFRNSFELGITEFFEPLRVLQPLTWSALTKRCAPPFVVELKSHPGLFFMYTITNDLIVEIGAFQPGDDLRDWDELYATLPEFMRGYYQNFNGMHASFEQVTTPFNTFNLPAGVGRWTRLSDYTSDKKTPKKRLQKIFNELGDLENVDILIWTEWDDLILVNQNTRDKRLYVVPEGKFEDYFELRDAQHQIDMLCAHVLTGSIEPYFLRP